MAWFDLQSTGACVAQSFRAFQTQFKGKKHRKRKPTSQVHEDRVSKTQGSVPTTQEFTALSPPPVQRRLKVKLVGVGAAGTCTQTWPPHQPLLSLVSGNPGPGVSRGPVPGSQGQGLVVGKGGWAALLPHLGTGTHAPGFRPLHSLLGATVGYYGLL